MNEVEQMELLIKRAKIAVDKGEALKRLRDNKDFKLVILDFYLNDYAAMLVREMGTAQSQLPSVKEFMTNQLTAIGHLSAFMDITLTEGETAKEDLEMHEEERLAAINEEI